MRQPSGFNVFYIRGGETKTYLSTPTTESIARQKAEEFEALYYGKQYPNGRGAYGVSRPWIGRVG